MILKTIISNVENELDKKEHYWINNSLTLEDKSRGAVHRWKEKLECIQILEKMISDSK